MFVAIMDPFRLDSLVIHNIEKSWDGAGGATGRFAVIFGRKKNRRPPKRIDLFAPELEGPPFFSRRLVLIPT